MNSVAWLEIIATLLLGLAVLHTFLASKLHQLGNRFREGSPLENLFHLLGEVEVVFGVWAGILLLFFIYDSGTTAAKGYLEGLNYTEPAFVFVIMVVCATKPIREAVALVIDFLAPLMPLPKAYSTYFVCLGIAPLLGSFITEPAAMTVIALLMKDRFFDKDVSDRFKYLTIGALFVNVSIGGVLTPYAAPPVLMVANQWGWDLSFMLTHFGFKAAAATIINALILVFLVRPDLLKIKTESAGAQRSMPLWVIVVHLMFLAWIVSVHTSMIVFAGVFLFFLGLVNITQEYQDELKLREGLLVAFFLGGLVVLGKLQAWWLQPTLASLTEFPLFLGATALTAITDNAALTYLGSQVPGLSDPMKYALVSGAVAGGGLTVIANAPNPAGYSILQSSFGKNGVSALHLFLGALVPTLIAMICLWTIPSF